ncbi:MULTISPECIES: hypothetical protein [Cyanophyceae]|uniref:hypothetical protein n=1 Tax=Cyanophyceae TaxID=3028117 RepID=UPI0016892471|nr:hypothetical protein [Trichocoleus sp. FACHB-40]MBD2005625.1 hypothetical protein [Trichocoleus sp. FACHB-40]
MAPMILSYQELRMWRDLCEFLSRRWYKCEEPDELRTGLPGCNVWKPEARTHRQELWDSWMIQFISWSHTHPALNYSNSRKLYRELKKWKGWTLRPDWEIKIDFLEKIVLLNVDPNTLNKPWQKAIQEARNERLRLEQQKEERLRQEEERIKAQRLARTQAGLCPWCGHPAITYMVDCLNCGKPYEIEYKNKPKDWSRTQLGDSCRYKGEMYTFVGYTWSEEISQYLLLLLKYGEQSYENAIFSKWDEIDEIFKNPFPTIAEGIEYGMRNYD